MANSAIASERVALRKRASVWFAFAGFIFIFGGALIHVTVGTRRLTAELEGFAIAAIFAAIGFVLKAASEKNLPENEDKLSEN
jgi:hypothetical protein